MQIRLTLLLLVFASALFADGPADNIPAKVRRIPPPGVKIPDADRANLTRELATLGKAIDALGKNEHLPDVQIYYNAVRYALDYDEFHKETEVKNAYEMLKVGGERARALAEGKTPWLAQTGLVPRGYVSKIDGSVQPYGLEIPKTFDPKKKHRLDFWFHGRGETLSELSFLTQRSKSPGQFHPADTVVLHPYGRYSNANHFAGEIDALEALAHAKKHYPIDDERIVVRGFSMGGAACWNYAVHYAYKWAAAAPGAGFSETPEFLRVFQSEKYEPAWYEKKLLRLYDCTDWALNLTNLPTVAYSGENDKQKQAADIMALAMKKEGLDLVHIIGPKTGHAYHPEAKVEIERLLDPIVAKGRNAYPKKIRFVTYTLRYNRSFWIRIDSMGEHWEQARVEADWEGDHIDIKTKNVVRLTVLFDKTPLPVGKNFTVTLDGKKLQAIVKPTADPADGSLVHYFHKKETGWENAIHYKDPQKLEKRHLVQGPIDDAFMDSFVMIAPTGTPMNEKVGEWTAAEMEHALEHWRRQFRGIARVKKDVDVTSADALAHNLILWGDPSSNAYLRKIADKLPIKWTNRGVEVGSKLYEPGQFVPVLVYPNPFAPKKYVVINSGFTYREYDYLNNARQTPKLPDWAIMDIAQPRTTRHAAGIADAGFFGERWELRSK